MGTFHLLKIGSIQKVFIKTNLDNLVAMGYVPEMDRMNDENSKIHKDCIPSANPILAIKFLLYNFGAAVSVVAR